MDRYFRYQLAELPKRPLRDWGKFRWQDEALSVIWLYNRTGAPKLLDLRACFTSRDTTGRRSTRTSSTSRRSPPNSSSSTKAAASRISRSATHGVNNGQAIKTGAVWSLVSGSDTDRKAAAQMIAELDSYHGLPNGMFSCDEHLAGRDPSQGSELCTVVEYMFSLERVARHSRRRGARRPPWSARVQRATRHVDGRHVGAPVQPGAEPGGVQPAPQALDQRRPRIKPLSASSPTSAAAPPTSIRAGPSSPRASSCSRAIRFRRDDGLVAAAYAPCEVRTNIRGTAVHIVEETDYPFRGTVQSHRQPGSTARFPAAVADSRVGHGATHRVNGKPEPQPQPGTFARVERTWKSGDRVEISFPMQPRISRWFNDSVAIERGPLVFSYGIGESWVKLRDRGMTADWQVYPTTPWNYAVQARSGEPRSRSQVSESEIGEILSRAKPRLLSFA